MKMQNWVKYISLVFSGMLFIVLLVVLLFHLIRVPVYPDLSGHYSTDFGMRLDDCGDVTKAGISLFKDGSYYSSKEEPEKIGTWYKQFGWGDFIIKGNDLGIVSQSQKKIGELQITTWKRAQYSAIPGSVHILTDSYLSLCWSG